MYENEMFYELCSALSKELEEVSGKIRNGGMSAGDLEMIDKLSHALKSIKTIMAMSEGYSGNRSYAGSYENRGGSYENRGGNSYGYDYENRGGGRSNARRGGGRRYSRYSYAMDETLDELREMIPQMPEEKRRKIENLLNELEK